MIRKSLVASVVFATALFLLPAIAGAHTEVTAENPPDAQGVVAAKVFAENECSTTIKSVQVVFPDAPPLATVTPATVPGWTSSVEKAPTGTAVTSVTWTNDTNVDGDANLPVELGAIPSGTSTVDFKALVTCADGDVERWVQPGENSDFPAPVLKLKSSGETPATTSTTTTAPASDNKSDDDNTGLIVGVVIAVVVIGGGLAFALSRRKK